MSRRTASKRRLGDQLGDAPRIALGGGLVAAAFKQEAEREPDVRVVVYDQYPGRFIIRIVKRSRG